MNEGLSNVLLTTPFMGKLIEIMENKAEDEEKRRKEEDEQRKSAKRKRSDSDEEDDDDPKGKGKEKADDDDFIESKQKKRKHHDENGSSDGHRSALPSSGFSLLSRDDLDMSKHYAHEETEIEESKVELIDEFLAPEVGQIEDYPWRILTDFTIYDISDDNRYPSSMTLKQDLLPLNVIMLSQNLLARSDVAIC